MSLLHGLPVPLLALVPLSLAAGVDLYLTLLLLAVAPALPGWSQSLPGALGELHSAGVVVMAGGFYALEMLAERWRLGALFWNTFHVIIRALAGALLALLLLDGQPHRIVVLGAVVAGAVASAAQAVRSGGSTFLWLTGTTSPRPLLVSLGEDAGVLGLVALVLDRPDWAVVASVVLIVAGLPTARTQLRAFGFAVSLAWGLLWRSLGSARWTRPEDLPKWVRTGLAGDVMAPGGGLRGARAAGYRLPGAPRFATGWVVVRGDDPAFVFRSATRVRRVELRSLYATAIDEGVLFRRVDLDADGSKGAHLYFGPDGPGPASLRAELPAGGASPGGANEPFDRGNRLL